MSNNRLSVGAVRGYKIFLRPSNSMSWLPDAEAAAYKDQHSMYPRMSAEAARRADLMRVYMEPAEKGAISRHSTDVAEVPFVPGIGVEIVGLTANTAMNGRRGELVKYVSSRSRWSVRLHDSGKNLGVAESNLRVRPRPVCIATSGKRECTRQELLGTYFPSGLVVNGRPAYILWADVQNFHQKGRVVKFTPDHVTVITTSMLSHPPRQVVHKMKHSWSPRMLWFATTSSGSESTGPKKSRRCSAPAWIIGTRDDLGTSTGIACARGDAPVPENLPYDQTWKYLHDDCTWSAEDECISCQMLNEGPQAEAAAATLQRTARLCMFRLRRCRSASLIQYVWRYALWRRSCRERPLMHLITEMQAEAVINTAYGVTGTFNNRPLYREWSSDASLDWAENWLWFEATKRVWYVTVEDPRIAGFRLQERDLHEIACESLDTKRVLTYTHEGSQGAIRAMQGCVAVPFDDVDDEVECPICLGKHGAQREESASGKHAPWVKTPCGCITICGVCTDSMKSEWKNTCPICTEPCVLSTDDDVFHLLPDGTVQWAGHTEEEENEEEDEGGGGQEEEEKVAEVDPFMRQAAQRALSLLPRVAASDCPSADCCPICQECVAEVNDALPSPTGWLAAGSRPTKRCWHQLPCEHKMCSSCGDQLAEQGDSGCPLCRASFLPPPCEGDRVRIVYPATSQPDEGGKKSAADANRTRSLWDQLRETLHGMTGVVLTESTSTTSSDGAPTCTYTIRLDVPPSDAGVEGGGLALDVVRVPSASIRQLSQMDSDVHPEGWPMPATTTHGDSAKIEALGSLDSSSYFDGTDAASRESNAQPFSAEQHAITSDPGQVSLDLLNALSWSRRSATQGIIIEPLTAVLEMHDASRGRADGRVRCGACWLWQPPVEFSSKQMRLWTGKEGKQRRFEARCKQCIDDGHMACADAPVAVPTKRLRHAETPEAALRWLEEAETMKELRSAILAAMPHTHALPAELEAARKRLQTLRTAAIVASEEAAAAAASARQQQEEEEAEDLDVCEEDEEDDGADGAMASGRGTPASVASSHALSVTSTEASTEQERRVQEVARIAKRLVRLELPELALLAARGALENSASLSHAAAAMPSAAQPGVVLARNVLAKASGTLAHQNLALARVVLEENVAPDYHAALGHAEHAARAAHDAMRAVEMQLGDALLALKATYTDAARDVLVQQCDAFATLRRTAEALVEQALAGTIDEATSREAEKAAAHAAEHVADGAVSPSGRDESGDDELAAAIRASRAQHEVGLVDGAWADQAEAAATGPPVERISSVQELLDRGKWTLSRSGGHRVYHRKVAMVVDEAGRTTDLALVEQTCTIACTPSDRRAHHNALAQLRRLDDGVLHAFPASFKENERGAQVLSGEKFTQYCILQERRREHVREAEAMRVIAEQTALELTVLESEIQVWR